MHSDGVLVIESQYPGTFAAFFDLQIKVPLLSVVNFCGPCKVGIFPVA